MTAAHVITKPMTNIALCEQHFIGLLFPVEFIGRLSILKVHSSFQVGITRNSLLAIGNLDGAKSGVDNLSYPSQFLETFCPLLRGFRR
jgi:hypothetical protein